MKLLRSALLVAGILPAFQPCTAAEIQPKRVLILNSYHANFQWTESQVQGITLALADYPGKCEIHLEYLDTKRITREDYLTLLAGLLRMKYAGVRLDIIIATDDDALTFLLKHRDAVFGTVPVVFCGIDDASPQRIRGINAMTGVLEVLDIQPTLDLGMRLFPSARTVYVITDNTPTGRAQRASVAAASRNLGRLLFQYLNGEDLSHTELFVRLRSLPPDGIILMAVWERDRNSVYMPLELVLAGVTSNASLPILVLTDSRLRGGTLGGRLVSAKAHGADAGRLAVRILNGEPADRIPIQTTSSNPCMFDYHQLQRWGIPTTALPPGSTIINQPDNFYRRYKQAIWSITGVFLFLVSVIVVLTVNIMRRRRAEAAVREIMQFNEEVISNAGEGIVVFDRNLCYVLWNAFMEQLTGVPAKDVIGKHAPDVFPHVREHGIDKLLERALAGERVTSGDVFFRIPQTGRTGWTLNTYGPNRDDRGEIVGAVGIIHDITRRKQTEAELERYRNHLEELVKDRTVEIETVNRELEAFSYSVSHDLRAPLRAMDGFSQALLEDYGDRLDTQGREYLDRVRKASQRMGQLIDDLLKLSRITRAEMHMEEVDLSGMAMEVAEELRRTEPDRHVEILIERGLKARGDARLLRVLLTNLIGNAWKFTGKTSGARIEFAVEYEQGHPVFRVRDNGAGFDMTYSGKLFGAFQRLHGATEFEGTGIGLATSQRIVHRHGGRIWAEGEIGKGATFRFRLD